MNLKAIIVDDENHSRETLKNLIEEFCSDVEVVASVSSVQKALIEIPNHKPDVVFLDIELQTGTGFNILEQLHTINFEVIFTTSL